MKKAMIYAYTAVNFGDDLFIYTLCSRYRHTQFYLYAPAVYKNIFKDINNLHIISNDTFLLKILHRLPFLRFMYRSSYAKKCDLAIYIGGSLFMEIPGWKKTIKQVKKMFADNRDIFILGANFGPYYSQHFYHAYLQIFKRTKDVCFRDTYSKRLFQHLPQVRHGRDIVFNLPIQHVDTKHNTIVISVIYPSIRKHLTGYDDIYFNSLRTLAITLIDKGYDIVWMAFCTGEGDLRGIHQICSIIPARYQEKMETWVYKENLHETLEIIQEATAVIATRFHALILSAVYKKPVYPIIYSDKMKQILNDCDFSGSYSKLEDIGRANQEDIIAAIHSQTNILSSMPAEEEQFRVLDQYL